MPTGNSEQQAKDDTVGGTSERTAGRWGKVEGETARVREASISGESANRDARRRVGLGKYDWLG